MSRNHLSARHANPFSTASTLIRHTTHRLHGSGVASMRAHTFDQFACNYGKLRRRSSFPSARLQYRTVLSKEHVHMFVEIPPHIAVSDFVRHVKGRSSHRVQMEFPAGSYSVRARTEPIPFPRVLAKATISKGVIMRLKAILASGVVAIFGLAVSSGASWSQNQKLAPEGRGLLAKPAEPPENLGGVPPLHVFSTDPSGAFARTLFETDDDPDFKITIREYSFPPDKKKHTLAFPSGAFARLLDGSGEITLSNNRLDLSSIARAAVPAGAPIDVVNDGDSPMIVRTLILEAK